MCFEESERMQAVETSKAKNDRKHKERTTDSKVTIFFVVFQFLFLIKGNIWLQVTCAFWRGGGTYHEARKQLKRALVTVKSTVRLRSGGMSSCLRAVNMSRLKGAEQPCWQQCYWMVFNVVPPAKPPPLALMLGKRWAETAALKWKKNYLVASKTDKGWSTHVTLDRHTSFNLAATDLCSSLPRT